MNKGKFLRTGPAGHKQIYIYISTFTNINIHIKIGSTPHHCVLLLIGYRIDLLLFISMNRIVLLLLKKTRTNIHYLSEIIYYKGEGP